MLKLIGAMLILLSGTLWGFHQAGLLARRPKQLADLIRGLQRLETEIIYGFTPLPEALLQTGEALPDPTGRLLRTAGNELMQGGAAAPVHQVWDRCITEQWRSTAMKAPERETLRQLGGTLGLSDREDQAKHLKLCMLQLQAEEQTARDEQQRYERMWRSLGVLIGALAVIIMY